MTSNLIDPFRSLRETQARAMQQQHLFSGLDWLRATAFVQLLMAIYPTYLWASFVLFPSREASDPGMLLKLQILALATLIVGLVLGLLAWWAKYAPFRASVVALFFYVGLNVFIAVGRPDHFLDGLAPRMLVLLGLVQAVRTSFRRHRAT